MNERIKLLADQAKNSIPKDTLGVTEWIDAYNQRFAELIVEECGIALHPMLRDMISRGQAYDLIQQHFGVKL